MSTGNGMVLLVDDEPDIRLIVGLNLSLLGLEYAETGDGADAIEKLLNAQWDACVLDLSMPGVDGFSVLQQLAAHGRVNDLAVIVLSGRGSPAEAIAAIELGAHAHIGKPFSPSSVAATVKELLSLTPAERETMRRQALERAGKLDQLGSPSV